ncbi:hypothetical protein ABTK66_18660, partial [Acinetobacter baumannii]
HTGVALYQAQDFTPDSRELLMTSNDGGEFSRVIAYDLASGKTREVERADWDVAYTGFSKDGRFRVTGINADASVALRLYRDGQPMALPQLP